MVYMRGGKMKELDEPLWSVHEVAAYLKLPVNTLYQWRRKGYGPLSGRIGKHLRYRPIDVRQWFANQSKGVA